MFAHAMRLLMALLLAGLLRPADAATAFVEGEALYRERILPPPGATRPPRAGGTPDKPEGVDQDVIELATRAPATICG